MDIEERVIEGLRHLVHRDWLVPVGNLPVRASYRALWRSMPTFAHATQCFERAVDRLGERGFVDPAGGEHRRWLYLRDDADPALIVAEPILTWATQEGSSRIRGPVMDLGGKGWSPGFIPADAPEGWTWDDPPFDPGDPRPDIVPTGPRMHGGTLAMREGPSYLEMTWGADGLQLESSVPANDRFFHQFWGGVKPHHHDPTARPPLPLPVSPLCSADLRAGGVRVPEMAAILARLDPGERVPARVLMPAALPAGPGGVRASALPALRRALWHGEVPDEALWLACDGFEGTALGWGTTRQEALQRCRASIARNPPFPPHLRLDARRKQKADREAAKRRAEVPEQPAGPIRDEQGRVVGVSTGTIRISGGVPGSGLPWPEIGPDTTPILVLPVPAPLPPTSRWVEAGYDRPVRLLDRFGAPWRGIVRRSDARTILPGEGLLDALDPATLDAELEAADRVDREDCKTLGLDYRVRVARFFAWDSARRRRAPLQFTQSQSAERFDPGLLADGEAAFAVTLIDERGST